MNRFRWGLRVVLLLADLAALEGIFYATYLWRFRAGIFVNPVNFTAAEFLVPSFIVAGYWILLNAWFGLYRMDPLASRARVARDTFQAIAVGVLLLFILTFDPAQPLPSSRIILASYGVGIFLLVLINRLALLTILREFRVHGIGVWKTVLVGSGPRAIATVRHVRLHPELGMEITGAIAETGQEENWTGFPILGSYADLRSVLESAKIECVLFAPEPKDEKGLGRMVRLLKDYSIRSFIQIDQYQLLIGSVKPLRIQGHPLIEIRPEILTLPERMLKRLTDLLFAIPMFLLTLPLWIILLIWIPLDSKGSPIFTQRRVGRGGKEFTMLKFRSMFRGAEELTGPVMAVRDDPRVTRVGRLLRATRVDELPQLINIIVGQMSLVGPRPERREFVERFIQEIPLYERRLNVKPGLTGWSQVQLKYDSRADQTPAKLQYDFYYIENLSLPLDFKILLMTLFVIARGEGL